MNLRIKKLKQIPIGASLEVHYGNGNVFTGVITDKDDECIAIMNNGREIVIDYEDVELYIEGSQEEASAKQNKNDSDVKTLSKQDSAVGNHIKPSFEIQIEKSGVSDNVLKNAFSELDAACKKKLNNRYDRFMYALRISDWERGSHSFNALLNDIESDDSLLKNEKVWRFAALMALRCNKATEDILIKGKCFIKAAINAFLEERYSEAGAFGCLAVLYDEFDEYKNAVYTIIYNSCIKCDDVSAVTKMLNKSGVSELNMELMHVLLLNKNKETGGISMSQIINELDSLYVNREMEAIFQKITDEYNLSSQETISENGENENIDAVQSSGEIIKLIWSRDEGIIKIDDGTDKECTFIYDDISDESLKNEVKKILATNVEEKNWYVSFELLGNKAINIKRAKRSALKKENSTDDKILRSISPEEALKKGRYIISSRADTNRFAEAADTFEIALSCEGDRTDALSEFINACIAYKNATTSETDGEKYLEKALEAYNSYDNNITHDFKYDVVAFSLMIKYGTTSEKIKAINRLLKYDSIKPQQRLVYIASLADIYLKEAEQSKDKETYEKAKKGYQEWESVFHSNAKLFSAVALNTTYYTRILLNLAICLIRLDEKEQAEQILLKVLKYDSSIEAANRLYNELADVRTDYENEDETDKSESEIDEEIYFESDNDLSENEDVPSIDTLQPYADVSGWDALNLTEKDAIDYVLSIKDTKKSLYTVALLKVLSDANKNFYPLYQAVSMALDNPLESLGYTASDVISAFDFGSTYGDSVVTYSFASAALRSAFYQTDGSDYMLNALCDSVQLCNKYPKLKEALEILSGFKTQYDKGVDAFAKYRFTDLSTRESALSVIVKKITDIYEQEFSNKLVRENINQIRFKITKVFVYEKGGILESVLRSIKDNDITSFDSLRESFAECFIRKGLKIQKNNIQDTKIDAFIDDCWDRAGRDDRVVERKTSDLMGSLRNNLRSHISNIVNVVCDWTELYDNGLIAAIDSEEKRAFSRIQNDLTTVLSSLYEELIEEEQQANGDEYTGIVLLADTVDELKRKLTGDWNQNERKYYFSDFLSTNNILLDENFLPDFTSTFYSLPNFNILTRLRKHIEDKEKSLEIYANQIYSRNKYFNNFGTAKLISEYTQNTSGVDAWYPPENAEEYCLQAKEKIKSCYAQFIEEFQLANGKGQIMLYDEFMNCIDETAMYWYSYCISSNNFGFFFNFVDACMSKIHLEAGVYEKKLLDELDIMYSESPELFEKDETRGQVEEQIRELNFLVAEDWMNRLRRGDFYNPVSANTVDAIGNLNEFWKEFDVNYDSSKDTGVALRLQVNRGGYIPAKDKRGGMSLITNWLSNGSKASCVKIESILNALGWENICVTDTSTDSLECYRVKSTEKYNRRNYPHPIAAFGTSAKITGFNVVCLYGFYDANRLISKYRELDDIKGNKIILLDFALNAAERRRLARKIKEITLASTYLLIDRVSVLFIANHYVSGMNNGMLMSISLPFSYCQPYDVSAINMVPEMFIGRKDELLSIESATGANLIFGGRQLGKSSLLKKAKNDIDGDELGRKAVFLDLKGVDYKSAALKISRELVDRNILSNDNETSNWDDLERAIINRLRDEENEIPYLLLMLDEADCLIESSKDDNFLPMVKLKNIQQSSNGRFKFVLAGLHNLVRFNRSVALGKNSVITHLSSINIKPFRHEDAKDLLLIPLSYLGFSFNDDSVLISQILAATNYFPGLIQLYCEKLIEAMKNNYADYNENETPPYVVTETHIKKVLSDKSFRDEIKDKFEITLTLDDTYYIIALIMALLSDSSENQRGCSAKDIMNEAKSLSIDTITKLSEEQVNAFLGELVDLNILKNTGTDIYAFSTKNFRDMLGSQSEVEEKLLSLME